MTQLESAKRGKITNEVKRIAALEGLPPDVIRRGVAKGRIVIPKNINRKVERLCGIGEGLRTKVNANIGTSKDSSSIADELSKMTESVSLGADTVMDLSTGAKIIETRRMILKNSKVPVGTVPIYEMMLSGINSYGSIKKIPADYMFNIMEGQARDGVDFFTIHAGVTKKTIEVLRKHGRILDIVSRGGAFLTKWILENRAENPFYEYFDRVLSIAKRYDVTLSLGDGLRPGSVCDATDPAQISELATLGELQREAFKSGVQSMIEGPGHVPIDQIETNVILEKSLCNAAPFYVLGPLVTDVAPGYDHITSAIGGAIAGSFGADFLCYVTPAEHLRLPTIEDVREGMIASRIAAHAADIAKGVEGAIDWDIKLSRARRRREWKRQFKLAMDNIKPQIYRNRSRPGMKDVCTMCSEYCSIKISEKCFRNKIR